MASKRRRPATCQLAGRRDRGLASHGGGDDPAGSDQNNLYPGGSLIHISIKSPGLGLGRSQHDADASARRDFGIPGVLRSRFVGVKCRCRRSRGENARASRAVDENYRSGCFPGRRRIRSAPSRRAPRNTTMPMNGRYNRPFATTPTIPSTIATITYSRKKGNHLILRSLGLLSGRPTAAHRRRPPPISGISASRDRRRCRCRDCGLALPSQGNSRHPAHSRMVTYLTVLDLGGSLCPPVSRGKHDSNCFTASTSRGRRAGSAHPGGSGSCEGSGRTG